MNKFWSKHLKHKIRKHKNVKKGRTHIKPGELAEMVIEIISFVLENIWDWWD